MLAALIPMQRPTFEAAIRDAGSKKREARLAAADRLSSPPRGLEAEAAEALAILADDGDAAIRRTALLSLGALDAGRAHLELVLLRFDDGEPPVRQAAVIAAGRLGGDDAETAIREALESAHPDMRFQAVMSVVEIELHDATALVTARLRDDDVEVRAHAAEGLGKLGDPAAKEALAKALEDDAKLVRYEAALALASLDDARGVEVLREALHAPETAIAAAMALGDVRAENAREDLAQIAKRMLLSPLMRAAVGGALCRLDDDRGVAALRGAMHALRADGRGLAVQLAGELKLVALAEDLATLARRPRGADPVTIAEALGRLAGESAIARRALEEMARGDDEEGARAAQEALR
jgi:HEAT repeat protein